MVMTVGNFHFFLSFFKLTGKPVTQGEKINKCAHVHVQIKLFECVPHYDDMRESFRSAVICHDSDRADGAVIYSMCTLCTCECYNSLPFIVATRRTKAPFLSLVLSISGFYTFL